MKEDQFALLRPRIADNQNLREPQREAFGAIGEHFSQNNAEREVGIVLPVGCGKSGLITIAPFAVQARRALVVAPGLSIARQLKTDFDPAEPAMFYRRIGVLDGSSFPEPAEIRGNTANFSDLEQADVVITNIHQLQGDANRWLAALPADFFDLILVDEGHHNVAESWEALRRKFPSAKILNFSATPTRADGQLMAGKIIYSFPIFRAIEKGYVKRLKAVVLNPKTLRYVRQLDGREVTVDLDEVRRLGEDDSDFRRSIVSSPETLRTIVDCSIRELQKLRAATGDKRHKIIVSALNLRHCIQIKEEFVARGLRAEYVHTKEDGKKNEQAIEKLNRHELDVIIQVRKLGEGFDHPYLSVAAVCSLFANLAPFAQFVGRIMRVIEQNAPNSALNQGTVVFHAGSNTARRWTDFQTFSQADQEFFDRLLPMEEMSFEDANEITLEPEVANAPQVAPVVIRTQEDVTLEEIPLIEQDQRAREALEYLVGQGYSPGQIMREAERLSPVPVTKQRRRQASRIALDEQIKTAAGRILRERGINFAGFDLDRQRRQRSNFQVLKSAIDRQVWALIKRKPKQRADFSQAELDVVEASLESLVNAATAEVFDGKT